MPQSEIATWREYHLRYPLDDYHRVYRPAALVSAALSGGSINTAIAARLKWLMPDLSTAHMTDADQRTLAAFGITRPEEYH